MTRDRADESTFRRMRGLERERGNLIAMAALFLSFVLTLVLSTLGVVQSRVQDMRLSGYQMVARHAALSGLNTQLAEVKRARDYANLSQAFTGVDALDPNVQEGPGGYTLVCAAEPLLDFSSRPVAEYDVVLDVRDRSTPNLRHVDVTCYAYVPTRADYTAGLTDAVRAEAHVTVAVKLDIASVFDYSYFINHWGWFFGDSIMANGNARANGQFDFGNYKSWVNGSPRYQASDGTRLVGYLDDNLDGVKDGTDGGAYAGMAIANASNVRGMASQAKNRHAFQGAIPMPNVTDQGYYEGKALEESSSISIGATKIVDKILGDDIGEKKNLYLSGTAANPIVLDGPVVVKGSVIISGYVTGTGAIYARGNIYVAKDLKYVNPPATYRPAANDQATVEAWREANKTKDALGLFAAEHIVLGNYTDSGWQSSVKGWVNHASNKSAEDAGTDGIHNTRAGRDGVLGTADDDVLEGDGKWTVTKYTETDAAKGLIPAGKSVGDVVPGSGEDIDADGQYDPTTAMTEFNIPATLNSTNWAGNVPSGSPTFASISSNTLSQIDAALYTNHTLAGKPSSSGDIQVNGAVVSRNEAIVYSVGSGKYLKFQHDERLTGHGAEVFGFHSPKAWEPLELTNWAFEPGSGGVCAYDPDDLLAAYTGG